MGYSHREQPVAAVRFFLCLFKGITSEIYVLVIPGVPFFPSFSKIAIKTAIAKQKSVWPLFQLRQTIVGACFRRSRHSRLHGGEKLRGSL